MRNEDRPAIASFESPLPPSAGDLVTFWRRVVRRRSFLQSGVVGLGIATATLPASALLAPTAAAATKSQSSSPLSTLNSGDQAILQFLLAVETLETDLWVQYNELGGNNGITNGAVSFPVAGVAKGYQDALLFLDSDMAQYISDNADDELSHREFLSAYLTFRGVTPVNLNDPNLNFATQPTSTVTGVPTPTTRLTNLLSLTVNTGFYTRYRSTGNPDDPFNDTFLAPDGLVIVNEPGIPPTNADNVAPSNPKKPKTRVPRTQAIANTAAFHFGFIEQGGSSLYPIMALKASSLEVLRIILSIGGTEIDHFSLWHDKLGGAVTPPLNVTDPMNPGASFPALANDAATTPNGDSLTQTNLILAEPCDFLVPGLPQCSVIRPTSVVQGGAVATIQAFKDDGLFGLTGPGGTFNADLFKFLMGLATNADNASRQVM